MIDDPFISPFAVTAVNVYVRVGTTATQVRLSQCNAKKERRKKLKEYYIIL